MAKNEKYLTSEEFGKAIDEATNQILPEIGITTQAKVHNADSLITPFKTQYLFHSFDLIGTAAIIIFTLRELCELTSIKATLKGDIIFNLKSLKGSIVIDFMNDTVYFKNKGHRYILKIDPSKRQLWTDLLAELKISIQNGQFY